MKLNIRQIKGKDRNEVYFSGLLALAEDVLLARSGKTIEQTVTTPYRAETPRLRDFWHECVSDYIPDEGTDFGSFQEYLADTIDSLEYDFGKGTKYTDLTAEQWKGLSENNYLLYLFIPVIEAIVEGLGEQADLPLYVAYF